jgi:hypothetical protein
MGLDSTSWAARDQLAHVEAGAERHRGGVGRGLGFGVWGWGLGGGGARALAVYKPPPFSKKAADVGAWTHRVRAEPTRAGPGFFLALPGRQQLLSITPSSFLIISFFPFLH